MADEELPDKLSSNSYRWRLILLAGALFIAAAASSPWDAYTAHYFADSQLPGEFRRLLNWSEAFAHGLGVAIIGIVVMLLDSERRKAWPRILLTAYGAGMLANVGKLSVARLRPAAFLADANASGTFQGWLPIVYADPWQRAFEHQFQSFPSGHTATAFGFACGLAAVYPRGRWLFFGLAILAGIQRVNASAHFPSDVLAGAALGCIAGAIGFTSSRDAEPRKAESGS